MYCTHDSKHGPRYASVGGSACPRSFPCPFICHRTTDNRLLFPDSVRFLPACAPHQARSLSWSAPCVRWERVNLILSHCITIWSLAFACCIIVWTDGGWRGVLAFVGCMWSPPCVLLQPSLSYVQRQAAFQMILYAEILQY
jgi:hypothetical protein